MESEIQWLINILLEQKLSPAIKALFLTRIADVEKSLRPQPRQPVHLPPPTNQNQSHGSTCHVPAHMQDEPITNSPVVQQALQARNQVIQQAMTGKPEAGRTSPRKF